MARGGARPGAGRKPGSFVPGSKSDMGRVKRQAVAEAVAAAKQDGETPLEYMLRVMRNTGEEDRRRDAMAIAAAPYLHARLSNSTVNVNDKRGVDELDTEDLIAYLNEGGGGDGTAAEEESVH